MLRGHTFDFNLTGEISSPDGCNGISGIEMLLRGVGFDVKIEGVICNDLLLASGTLEWTNPAAFRILWLLISFLSQFINFSENKTSLKIIFKF